MIALAHVVAPRIGQIARVGEVDRVLGFDVAPSERGLLERHAVLMALGDIDEGAPIGTEHPFVGREDQEIRIERLHVGRDDADAVRGIDQQRGAVRAATPR